MFILSPAMGFYINYNILAQHLNQKTLSIVFLSREALKKMVQVLTPPLEVEKNNVFFYTNIGVGCTYTLALALAVIYSSVGIGCTFTLAFALAALLNSCSLIKNGLLMIPYLFCKVSQQKK